MTWIETRPPTDPAVARALAGGMRGYPSEYSPERRGERRVPPLVANDNIVMSHSLIPAALEHAFASFAATLDPTLPLSRREHELIAVVVSSTNDCFY